MNLSFVSYRPLYSRPFLFGQTVWTYHITVFLCEPSAGLSATYTPPFSLYLADFHSFQLSLFFPECSWLPCTYRAVVRIPVLLDNEDNGQCEFQCCEGTFILRCCNNRNRQGVRSRCGSSVALIMGILVWTGTLTTHCFLIFVLYATPEAIGVLLA